MVQESAAAKTATTEDTQDATTTGATRSNWISTLQQRFNSNRNLATWTITAPSSTVVKISLSGLGDPLHKILGEDLSLESPTADDIVAALDANTQLREKLVHQLDEAWASYQIKGAILLYNDEADVQRAYIEKPFPLPSVAPNAKQPAKAEEAEEAIEGSEDKPDDENPLEEDNVQEATLLRAIDLLFVLNVLARARGSLLVADTELALEPGFLEQSYLCDDPRIIKLAQATGCVEETWVTTS
ncbi:MAG: hypothetical protein KC615_02885 [Anaerolineae bacterium]|nr:hypothetical protein [Anaerolineae bacterium]